MWQSTKILPNIAWKKLNLTALLYAKKLRAYRYKTGGIDAFKALESTGLGMKLYLISEYLNIIAFTLTHNTHRLAI